MIMYMDGFHWGFSTGQPCLNLFVSSWTLNSRTKYMGAILVVFSLAVLVEGSSKLRLVLIRRARTSWLPQQRHTSHYSKNYTLMLWRRIGLPGMHAIQALLGYILMLATMTFAVELLLAVVLGLGVGHAMFFPFTPTAAATDELANITHVTSNPCCQFQEQEAMDERQSLLLTTRSELAHEGETELQHSSAAPLLQSGNNHHVL